MGEQVIMSSLSNYLIIRTSWLFGYQSNNFLIKMIDTLSKQSKVYASIDSFSIPTSSRSIAKAIQNFIEIDGNGLYHFANKGIASSFDYISEINKLSGTNCIIEPVKYSEYIEVPLRPKYAVLSTKKYEALFDNQDDWKTMLQYDINKLIEIKLINDSTVI